MSAQGELGLAARLIAAQKAIHHVEKTSWNAYSKYAYAGTDEFISVAREALIDNGLLFTESEWRVEDSPPRIVVVYSIECVSTGERRNLERSMPVCAKAGMPADKAQAAALSYLVSYVLRGLLLISRQDPSADVDARDDASSSVAQGRASVNGSRDARASSAPSAREVVDLKALDEVVAWLEGDGPGVAELNGRLAGFASSQWNRPTAKAVFAKLESYAKSRGMTYDATSKRFAECNDCKDKKELLAKLDSAVQEHGWDEASLVDVLGGPVDGIRPELIDVLTMLIESGANWLKFRETFHIQCLADLHGEAIETARRLLSAKCKQKLAEV
ncbi:MAG TPA: ERF family protein [Lacipirellulaceae bacterium]|nr:ERF family protein [Lacipirellulaceae bacterium]